MKQFELEQNIMNCWTVCEDIKTVYEAIEEDKLDKNNICAVLLGMSELYYLKFEKLFLVFEELLKEKTK